MVCLGLGLGGMGLMGLGLDNINIVHQILRGPNIFKHLINTYRLSRFFLIFSIQRIASPNSDIICCHILGMIVYKNSVGAKVLPVLI